MNFLGSKQKIPFCLILNQHHFPRSIYDALTVLINNWTMEDWTQPRHHVFGAKLSRLQTLFARANKQTIKTTQF